MQAVSEGPSGPGLELVVLRMGAFTTKLKEPYQETLNLKFGDEVATGSFFDDIPESATPPFRAEFEFGFVDTSFKQRLPRPVSHDTEAGKVGLLWRRAF
jgi:hypothetical protein